MRLRILSLFAAIQILSFGIWSNLSLAGSSDLQANTLAQVHPATENATIPLSAEVQESELSLNFASRNMSEDRRFLNSIKQNQIETALKKLPQQHVKSVKNIILDYNPSAHRGLGGNSLIILRAVDMGTEEMIGVLIHELGHNVDFATLIQEDTSKVSPFKDGKLPIYESDPSLDFYRISWLSVSQRKSAAVNTDFVSGYAMSDPFEDFAETYVYYVLHNKDFKKMAAESEALLAKYRFMKYKVFAGVEFDTGDGEINDNQRPWDITVLDYNLPDFLS